MPQLILTNEGEEGGILIGKSGQRRIPPFDHGLRQLLRGLSRLVSSVPSQPEGDRQDLEALVNKLSNFTVGRIEAVIGSLDEDNSIIYADPDGGFVCGTGGKLPIPTRPSYSPMPTSVDLVEGGLMDQDMMVVISAANREKIELLELFESPMKVAESLTVDISERTAKDLLSLAPSQVEKIEDSVAREIVEFFHSVAKDGRFLDRWLIRPTEVAKEIGVELSDPALDRIIRAGSGLHEMGPLAAIVVIGVIVILIAAVTSCIGDESPFVVDRSGIEKF